MLGAATQAVFKVPAAAMEEETQPVGAEEKVLEADTEALVTKMEEEEEEVKDAATEEEEVIEAEAEEEELKEAVVKEDEAIVAEEEVEETPRRSVMICQTHRTIC